MTNKDNQSLEDNSPSIIRTKSISPKKALSSQDDVDFHQRPSQRDIYEKEKHILIEESNLDSESDIDIDADGDLKTNDKSRKSLKK